MFSFRAYLDCIVDCFGAPYDDREATAGNASLRSVCEEFGISIPKARKLLITAGVYSTEASRRVAELSAAGCSLEEIMAQTDLSRSSVSSYLPYRKAPYNMTESSRHAADSRKYRERKKAVQRLQEQIHAGCDVEDALWQAVIAYQDYPFRTSSGLTFSYTVRQKKNGEYSGELFVSRKESSKTLTKSSMLLALQRVRDRSDPEPPLYAGPKAIGQIFGTANIALENAVKLQKEGFVITGPKMLRCFGASYLYPVFIRIGVIQNGDTIIAPLISVGMDVLLTISARRS